MSRSSKEDLQNAEIWWRMGAELIFTRRVLGHMLEYQRVIPKTMWTHQHLDPMIKHFDGIREVAERRMMKAGGFDSQFTDDCFSPPWHLEEREAIDAVLKRALEDVSEIAVNALEKYREEMSKENTREKPP